MVKIHVTKAPDSKTLHVTHNGKRHALPVGVPHEIENLEDAHGIVGILNHAHGVEFTLDGELPPLEDEAKPATEEMIDPVTTEETAEGDTEVSTADPAAQSTEPPIE